MTNEAGENLPRTTALFDKQRAQLTEAFRLACSDGKVMELRVELLDANISDHDLHDVLVRLTVAAAEASPKLLHALGSDLPKWMLRIGADDYASWLGVDVPAELAEQFRPWRLVHFLPDNPLFLRADGSLAGGSKIEDLAHFRQIRDYNRAMRPAKRVGRPRKAQVKSGGRGKIELDEAIRIRDMKDAGKRAHEIARQLWPKKDPYSDAVRAVIRRRVDYANLHAPR